MTLWPRCTSWGWVTDRDGVQQRCERRAFHRGWHRAAYTTWSPVRPWVKVRVFDPDGNPVDRTG